MANVQRLDYRASLRAKPGQNRPGGKAGIDAVLGGNDANNILQPLYETNGGVLFPYTPTISGAGGTTNYDDMQFTHSNYKQNVYQNSLPNEITLTAEFTAQTDLEAKYLLAVLVFFRSVSKSYFGEQGAITNLGGALAPGKSGLPPPVLHFNYLGSQLFNNVPVVVKSYTYDLRQDVDYVPVVRGTVGKEDITYVPTQLTLTVVMDPQYNPWKIRKEFDLDKFKRGDMLNQGFI